jgi:hypothetical protein
MLNLIGEVLLVITRMDRPLMPDHTNRCPETGVSGEWRRAPEVTKVHS